MSVYDKLKALGVSLPPLTPPVAAFVPYTISGNLVFVSGHIARKKGKPWVGKLGREIATPEGQEAARRHRHRSHGGPPRGHRERTSTA